MWRRLSIAARAKIRIIRPVVRNELEGLDVGFARWWRQYTTHITRSGFVDGILAVLWVGKRGLLLGGIDRDGVIRIRRWWCVAIVIISDFGKRDLARVGAEYSRAMFHWDVRPRNLNVLGKSGPNSIGNA